MINNEELQISNKSYVNKDFQTIYPELVELVKNLTSRWNPETTNESDPVLVLLKLLGFMGDKLNYNIDKNILETFLPSATQETSVRQLLETNGYTKKYYQSASTYISVLYQGEVSPQTKYIRLEAFNTQFTDENNTITYTLLQDINIIDSNVTYGGIDGGLITEGIPKDLSINGNTSIQLSNLDENYRLYFPETMVAQNRIYVKNEGSENWNTTGTDGDGWSQVSNLNLYTPKSKNFKFGFDSNKNLPYIQFPDDIIELIGNGLNVKYIVTTGASGNIPRGRLTVMSNPSSDNLFYYSNNQFTDETVVLTDELNNQNLLRIFNYYASTNGQNPETIDEAYNNFKKTIGTFDTLVTPRDFANWLYMYIDPESSYPLVSNIQVSDRRSDTNFYQPVITYNEYGATTDYVYVQGSDPSDKKTPNKDTITPFDLVLYPLPQVSGYTSYDNEGNLQSKNYDMTFSVPNGTLVNSLINVVQDNQSTDHTYIQPTGNSPYLYKNYYSLNIRVSTVDKVNEIERKTIVNNIKQALFDNFNARKVDYGYEIPTDTIYNVVLNSDTRIKNVFLDDPKIQTKVMTPDGLEHEINSTIYTNMIAKNVLAGKVNLYSYLYGFEFDFSMSGDGSSELNIIEDIETLEPVLTLTNPSEFTLKENQVVQLFSNSFSTYQTATVGVNYYWYSDRTLNFNTLYQILPGETLSLSYTDSENVKKKIEYGYNYIDEYSGGTPTSHTIVNQNLIEPTFTMSPTGTGGTVLVDNTYYNQLGANEEIKFLKKNEKVFDSGTYLFYWKVNNSENNLFPNDEDYIILGEDEYFMYTDTSKSNVEIFSSGTKIANVGFEGRDWTCVVTDASELVDGDLSVYAGVDWQSINFNSTHKLIISQQTIVTLTQEDGVNYLGGSITNNLDPIPSNLTFNYKFYNESSYSGVARNDGLHDYLLRTRLDINCGPDLPQTLISVTTGNVNKYTEVITYKQSDNTTDDLENTTIKTNYLIQRSGNGVIDVKLSNTSEPFSIISYTEVSDDAHNLVKQGATQQGKQYKIEFKDLVSPHTNVVKVKVPRIDGYDTKFMVYFKKDGSDTVTVTGVDVGSLNDGVNILTASANEVVFTFTSSSLSGSKSFVVIDEIKIIEGINPIFVGASLPAIEQEINDITNGDVGFYSTYTIPNAKLIDIDDFTKAEVMWDKNNVLNKFTLAQINFDNTTKIDVLKSSLK